MGGIRGSEVVVQDNVDGSVTWTVLSGEPGIVDAVIVDRVTGEVASLTVGESYTTAPAEQVLPFSYIWTSDAGGKGGALTASFENLFSTDAYNVVGHLSTSDPTIQILNNDIGFGNILGSSVKKGLDSIMIRNWVPDYGPDPFYWTITYYDMNGQNHSIQHIPMLSQYYRPQLESVPEPNTFALLAVGVAGAVFLYRKMTVVNQQG